jgi:hypothetical protein
MCSDKAVIICEYIVCNEYTRVCEVDLFMEDYDGFIVLEF